ncbi:MAG: S-layer homology domain-containing protein [Hydrococcus sp. RM1_1_31]|nr:S-layer homology domain-containing protein [Hydrococcus sp. RM1_1_31]
MTNSPNPEPPRRKKLDSDEKIAIVFVFATIGGILWWGFSNGSGINFIDRQKLLAPSKSQPTARQQILEQPEESSSTVITKSESATIAVPEFDNTSVRSQRSQKQNESRQNRLAFSAAVPITSQLNLKPTNPTIPEKNTFQDVPRDRWYYPFVEGLSSQPLIASLSEGTFEPDKPITRAQMANAIDRAFNVPLQSNKIAFKDVPQGEPMAEDIDKAIQKGFMKGYSRDNFRPQENIPRYQVLVALATGLNLKPTKDPQQTLKVYEDASEIPLWAVEGVAAATEKGLVVNYPDPTLLNPSQSATRAEAVAMIYQGLVNLGKVAPVQSPYIVSSP